MSNRLQQLGIDRWPVADRLALLRELHGTMGTGRMRKWREWAGSGQGSPPAPPADPNLPS
jgi:hypothetical protein